MLVVVQAAPNRSVRGRLDSRQAGSAPSPRSAGGSWLPVDPSWLRQRPAAAGRDTRPRRRNRARRRWNGRAYRSSRSRGWNWAGRWSGEARIDFGRQGLGSARTAQRNLARCDTLDAPAAHGFALGQLQRLGAIHGEDCDTAPRLSDNPSQARVGEIGGASAIVGSSLWRAAGAGQQRGAKNTRQRPPHAW